MAILNFLFAVCDFSRKPRTCFSGNIISWSRVQKSACDSLKEYHHSPSSSSEHFYFEQDNSFLFHSLQLTTRVLMRFHLVAALYTVSFSCSHPHSDPVFHLRFTVVTFVSPRILYHLFVLLKCHPHFMHDRSLFTLNWNKSSNTISHLIILIICIQ